MLPPKDRDVAMVFQNYALYPHMDVYGNLAFALRLRKQQMAEAGANRPDEPADGNGSKGLIGKLLGKNSTLRGADAEIDRRVRHAAEILDLSDLLKRRPRQLSGGQRQRVALGRAIVREPQAFLMDEPLSNLDTQLRMQTRAEILKLHQRLKVTTIYVTHDQQEAMTMGDRLAVMKAGEIQQLDTPQRIYDHPSSLFVAGFIGSPAMNMIPVTVQRSGDQIMLANGDFALPAPPRVKMRLAEAIGKEMTLGVRPEHVVPLPMSTSGADTQDRIAVNVDVVEPLGAEILMYMSGTGGKQDRRSLRSKPARPHRRPPLRRLQARAPASLRPRNRQRADLDRGGVGFEPVGRSRRRLEAYATTRAEDQCSTNCGTTRPRTSRASAR